MNMSSQQITLVVSGSRGIGAEFVRQIAQSHPWDKVIATVRSPRSFGNPNVETLQLDINATESIKAAATQVERVDTLIVSAAIGKDELILMTPEEGFRNSWKRKFWDHYAWLRPSYLPCALVNSRGSSYCHLIQGL
jgi:Dehydrogenases with different specificities (related to short-chain alcohol dehydrogenases)